MARTFANLPQYLVPAWLSSGESGAKLRTWGETVDADLARLRAGVTRRFPRYAADADDDVALMLTGTDRGIPRGRTETGDHYAGRLRAWRGPSGHQLRGGAYGLIGQVLEYFGRPAGAYVQTHDVSQNFYRETSAGWRIALPRITWTWGTLVASEWSRFWVLAYMPTVFGAPPEFGDAALWGGALGTPGYSIGIVGLTPDDANALRRLLYCAHPWRPAGTQPEWLVVDFAGGGYDPDVYYDTWSRDDAGTRVAVRHDSCRYVSLDPEHNNTYAGDPDVWSTAVPLLGPLMVAADASYPYVTVELSEGAPSAFFMDVVSGGSEFEWQADAVPDNYAQPIALTVDMLDADPPVAGLVLHFPTGTYSDWGTYDYVMSTTFEGRPACFSSSVTLPDGSVYAGDPSSFPSTAQLVDDGDAPS